MYHVYIENYPILTILIYTQIFKTFSSGPLDFSVISYNIFFLSLVLLFSSFLNFFWLACLRVCQCFQRIKSLFLKLFLLGVGNG